MNRILVLVGPTGVGKTGVSLLLAKNLGTEIISADSMQIYRGMDIGTAKPSPADRAAVVHHMIDIVDPTEAFSTGRYIEEVVPLIERLHGAEKVPLIVGGTGLYIRAMTRGIFSGPSADWPLREGLLSVEREEPGSLYAYLSEIDAQAAKKIERNDTRRILRAIEVCMKGRGRMSLFQETLTRPLPYEFVKIGLLRERRELYGMIDARVDAMIRDGLEEEVKRVLDVRPDRTPLQAIGYKEMARYFAGEFTKDEAIRLVKRNTRRYAKRQLTWFKKEKDIAWIDVTGLLYAEEIFGRLKVHLDAFLQHS